MKRIFFTQQKPFGYMPLRMGLGYLQAKQIFNHNSNNLTLVPKLYTTRTHPLSGEYYVVEGSGFKAKAVEPRIEFEVTQSCELDLRNALISSNMGKEQTCRLWAGFDILARRGLHFPELDLGFRGATIEMLKDELLRLNPRTTIDTPFFVNLLEPIRQERLDAKK